MEPTEIIVSGPCRGRNISLAIDVIQTMTERGVEVRFTGGDEAEACALLGVSPEVMKVTDDTSVVLVTVKKPTKQKLTPEQLLQQWTDESGPTGWFFRGGLIMGCKPREQQFLELIRWARDTA